MWALWLTIGIVAGAAITFGILYYRSKNSSQKSAVKTSATVLTQAAEVETTRDEPETESVDDADGAELLEFVEDEVLTETEIAEIIAG